MMKFSITIPTYKSKFLKSAIESVLKQSYENWELIVVDDCSPENILDIVRPYLSDKRVYYHRNDHNFGTEHLAENWSEALKLCSGNYVICMGDDDMLPPDALHTYKLTAEKMPEVDVIHGQTEIIDENNVVTELMEPRWEKENVLQAIYYRWAGLGRQQFVGDFCYKISALRKNNGYYPLPLAWGSDDITAFIAATTNGIANTKEVCFLYRKNRYSISSNSNNPRKLQALRMQEAWFRNFLKQYSPQDKQEETTLRLLKDLLPVHFNFHTNDLLRKDMNANMCRLAYWILNGSKYGISIKQTSTAFLKSLKKT